MTASSFAAIHHHVMKQIVVSGAFPDLRVHHDGRFQANHLKRARCAVGRQQFVVSGHHVVVPHVAHVAFEFRAQRTVIPEAILTAVDFRILKDETPPLAESDDLFHGTCH